MARRSGALENLVRLPSKSFWKGRRVLITGHTGFKGSWLTYWLIKLEANVMGIGLKPITSPTLYYLLSFDKQITSKYISILNFENYKEYFQVSQPEIVFHLAAQPLVRESYKQPANTFATNLMGTVNTLELIRMTPSVKSAVMVTTDKVYENMEWAYPYRESDRLGGHDPYSASKAACEIAIDSYRRSFFVKPGTANIASARAGNVIGGGDWAAERLIPDAIRAWGSNSALRIRNPNSTRPWQHVLDPLKAYLLLAEKLWYSKELASAYNFGPNALEFASVKDIINSALKIYGDGIVQYEQSKDDLHESNNLVLDTTCSKKILNIHSTWNIDASIYRTINWYKNLSKGISASELCNEDLTAYGNQSERFKYS